MANVNKASTKGVVNSIEAGANSSNAMMYGSVSALQNSLNGSGNIHVAALPESVVSTGPVPSQLGAQGASTVLANLNGSLYMNNGQPSSVISSVNTSFSGAEGQSDISMTRESSVAPSTLSAATTLMAPLASTNVLSTATNTAVAPTAGLVAAAGPSPIIFTGSSVSLDESVGLQNAATTSVAGDSNDNDIISSALPSAFASRLAALGAGTPLQAAESGYNGISGSNVFTIDPTASIVNMTLTDAAGNALNGLDSGLSTVSGQKIYLFNDTINSDIVLGKTSAGSIVFAVYLQEQSTPVMGGQLWTTLYQPLLHPDATNPDDSINLAGKISVTVDGASMNSLGDATPGQHLFFIVGSAEAGLVVTGYHPANQSTGAKIGSGDTVNVSHAGTGGSSIGTNNQMIDSPVFNKNGTVAKAGEGMIFTFVTGSDPNYTGANLSQAEADVEANIQFSGLKSSDSAIFLVSQLQPIKAATVQVSAFTTALETGVNYVDGLIVNDTPVAVSRVAVMNSSGVVIKDSNGSVNNSSIGITFSGGNAVISGVLAGYQIEYFTTGVHNRVLIQNAGSPDANLNASFDIGNFSYVGFVHNSADVGALISFEDSAPTVTVNPLVHLDDAALTGGSGGGTGDVLNTTGVLAYSYGTDGPGTISWLGTGAPVGFSYVVSGSTFSVNEGATTVLTVTLDPATGNYSVVQNAAILHAPGDGTNSQSFDVGYRVTDKDGDPVQGVLSISVKDDIPSVTSNALVRLDDAALAGGHAEGAGDVANTTGILAHSFGADGAGSIVWRTTGSPTGFTYETLGTSLLVKEAGVTVMTLTLDTASGAYTVAQNAAIQHTPGDGINSQAFVIGYQVIDKDSDPVNGVLNITVKDDVPSVTANALVHLDDAALAGGSGGGSGEVSNTTGVLAHNFGADGLGSIAWRDTGAPTGFTYVVVGNTLQINEGAVTVMTLTVDAVTGAYSVVQNAAVLHAAGEGANAEAFVVNYSVTDRDSDSIGGILVITVKDDIPSVTSNALVRLDDAALTGGQAEGAGDVANTTGILAHSFGADGAGSIGWLTTGAPTGFTYEALGTSLLVKEGGLTVMTLTLDTTSGAYTVTQNAALQHAPADGTNSQAFAVAYQVIDKDNDPVDGVLNINIKDDIPSVTSNVLVRLDDAALAGGQAEGAGDVANISGILTHSFGADGAGSIAWLTSGAPDGFTYEALGTSLLIKEAGVTVMTLSLDTTSGAYTVTQNAAIQHAPANGANSQAFAVNYEVLDKDSDPVDGVLNINVKDDIPSVASNVLVRLDDAALSGGQAEGAGDVANTTGVLAHSFGADGAGSIAWLTSGAPDGFTYEALGTSLLIKEAGIAVMTLTLDTTSGAYTVTQNAALQHAPANGANSQAFAVNYEVLDKDSDPVDGVLNITVKDDIPSVTSNALVSLDDAALSGGHAEGAGDVANTAGILAHSFGADGAGSIAWLTTGAPTGFTYEALGTSLLIKEAGIAVMTLTLDGATGAYTVVQNAALQHAPANGANSQAFAVNYEVLDKDSDPVDGVLNITVKDDIPSVTSNALVRLDDAALAGGQAEGAGDVANTAGILAHSFGADGAGSIAWLTTGAPTGFTYEALGTSLLIKEAGIAVMTLTLDGATGAYTVVQNAALQHAPANGANSQAFAVNYEVLDKDSDPVDGVLSITVKDDIPSVTSNALVRLDDAALAGGHAEGAGDVANTAGILEHSFGADGAGSIAWLTTGSPEGFTYEALGTSLLVKEAGITVMTLTLDSATGAYTVVQNAALQHAPANGANSQAFAVNYEVLDKDSDPVDGVLNITVKDDIPSVTSNALVRLDDAALTGGHAEGAGDVANTTGILTHNFGADGAGSISWLTTGAPTGFTYEALGSSLLVKEAGLTVMTLTLDTTSGAYTVTQNAALQHAAADGTNSQAFAVGYQVLDKDSDPVDGVLNITVKDDIPSVVSNELVELDDAALSGGSGGATIANTSGVLAHDFGADGQGMIEWLDTGAPSGFTFESTGSTLLVKQGLVNVMTLTVDQATGAYTVVQNAAVSHPAGDSTNSIIFDIDYRVTDKDSDPVAGLLIIAVKDDIPSVSSNVLVHLDDAALPGGSGGGTGDVLNTTGTLSHSYGADGAGSIVWLTTGSPTGFTYQASGSDLLVVQGTTTVMTLTVDSNTGAYTVVQNAAVDHTLGGGTNSQAFDVGYKVFDKDGDAVSGSLGITVKDDIPSGSFNQTVLLDDAVLTGGSGGSAGSIAYTTGTLDHHYNADSVGVISWLTDGAPTGFTYVTSGDNLLVKQNDLVVMTLTLTNTSTGDYTVVQNAPLSHAAGLGTNTQDFTVSYLVTDHDGDTDIGPLHISVKDDVPSVTSNALVRLDDAALTGGHSEGAGDVANTTGILAHSFGADGAGSIAWLTTGAPTGFTYDALGTSLLVKEAGITVMTLTLDATSGAYVITQNAAVQHAPAEGTNSQAFAVGYQVLDKDSDPVTGVLNVAIKDDVPSVASNVLVRLDDAALTGGHAAGAGDVANTTGILSHSFGADGAGSISWLTSGNPVGYTYEAAGTSLLVKQAGVVVMTLTADATTGAYTVVQNAALLHPSGAGVNSQAFNIGYQVSDKDSDPVDGSLSITVKDDVPIVNAISDASYSNNNNPSPGGSGIFSYSIGADYRTVYDSAHSDFSIFSLLGQVGRNSITNSSATWVSESSTAASFNLAFDYQPNETSTFIEHATGTLNFNKTAGTYTIALNAPIDGYTISTTSSASAFIGYTVGSNVIDNTQPEVSVAQLSTNLFAQFTGVSEPGGGTGTNNLQAVGVDGSGGSFVDGELFTQASTWVSTSNLANGVAGDTLQKGEVLNLGLYNSNPYGFTNITPTVQASSMFLKFDGINNENLIAVLKLVDSVDGTRTTKALAIDNADILKAGNSVTPNYGINLDSNDGAVVIESNDYNSAGQHYLITGAQLLVSTEGITGTAINFNSALGAAGASTTTQQMGAATTDNDVIKVSDIGIVTQQRSTLDSVLHIALAVKDADIDPSATQTLNVLITGSAVTSPIVLDMNGDGAIQYLDRSAGVTFDYQQNGQALSTAWMGSQDGLLALQKPDQSLNIVFSTMTGESDMQGLAKIYDTNHDNVLSALDSQYRNFGVWQDTSTNGKVESGEFVTLAQAGITSIALVPNSTNFTAASGEVHVTGQSTFTKADGTIGRVDDASFSTGLLTTHSSPTSASTDSPLVQTDPLNSKTITLVDVLPNATVSTLSESSVSNLPDAKLATQSVAGSTTTSTDSLTIHNSTSAEVSVSGSVDVKTDVNLTSVHTVSTVTAPAIDAGGSTTVKPASTTLTLTDVLQSSTPSASVSTTTVQHDTAVTNSPTVVASNPLPIHEEVVHATL